MRSVDGAAAARWARAVLAASSGTAAEAALAVFDGASSVVRSDGPEARWFLDPGVPAAEKEAALAETYPAAPAARAAVCLLLRAGKARSIPAIRNALKSLLDELSGIVDVSLESAGAISEDISAEMVAAVLGIAGGRSARVSRAVDPSLLGGVRVRWKGAALDATLARALAELGRVMAGNGA